jgi:histone acetyltransferase (RNA polymerase elongator complex component)
MIIPIFIPHAGCPHQCVFCNQKKITGRQVVEPSAIPGVIWRYLGTAAGSGTHEIAFYGGTFTALPAALRKAYLDAAIPFIRSGRIKSIRLSTRPDAITAEILSELKTYGVATVELGVQSMDDRVLAASGRGHTAQDTIRAVGLLKEYGFRTGLQLMPGLPGDSEETFLRTVAGAIALKPDFVRIYPALVIRDTPLEQLHKEGRFTPLALDNAVELCCQALILFESAGIDVIRIGLQPSEELEREGTIVAGPFHPAFRQLVESSLLLDRMRTALAGRAPGMDILVHPSDLSSAIGQKRSNLEILKKEFGPSVRIRVDAGVPRHRPKPGV